MRFKKGTKVEVLNLKEGSPGSWRCAEILSSNSHHYTVSYDGDVELFGKATVDRVSHKAVRPCSPPTLLIGGWVPGDVAEVLYNFSWRMATILKVSGKSHVFVRLFGSGIEFKASMHAVRVRLCWQDGEWIVIGEASNKCEDLRSRTPSSRNNYHQQQKPVTLASGYISCDNILNRNTNIVQESQATPSKLLKRKLYNVHSQVEAYAMPAQKKTKVGKQKSLHNQFNVVPRSQLPEKVDNIASSREVLHEKYMHPSLIKNINGCSDMNMEREQTNDVSVSTSVASCSSVYRNSSHKVHPFFTSVKYKDNESQCSDAESCCYLRSKEEHCVLPTKEILIEEIHRIELNAYRCTIGALYESGPLSWERQLLLTNLRGSLHISNDEHLAEIRSLVSSRNCIPTS